MSFGGKWRQRGRFWGRYWWFWWAGERIGGAAMGSSVFGCGDGDGSGDGGRRDLRHQLTMVKMGEGWRKGGSVIGSGKGQRGDCLENRKAPRRYRGSCLFAESRFAGGHPRRSGATSSMKRSAALDSGSAGSRETPRMMIRSTPRSMSSPKRVSAVGGRPEDSEFPGEIRRYHVVLRGVGQPVVLHVVSVVDGAHHATLIR